jgi:hypothetical protein
LTAACSQERLAERNLHVFDRQSGHTRFAIGTLSLKEVNTRAAAHRLLKINIVMVAPYGYGGWTEKNYRWRIECAGSVSEPGVHSYERARELNQTELLPQAFSSKIKSPWNQFLAFQPDLDESVLRISPDQSLPTVMQPILVRSERGCRVDNDWDCIRREGLFRLLFFMIIEKQLHFLLDKSQPNHVSYEHGCMLLIGYGRH